MAEGIAREARLRLFEPRVLAMDAYPVATLPSEQAAVFVASTTGQVQGHARTHGHGCSDSTEGQAVRVGPRAANKAALWPQVGACNGLNSNALSSSIRTR